MNPATLVKAVSATALAAGALIVGALVLGGSDTASGDPARASVPAAMPVEVIVVESKPIRLWTEFSARLHAVDEVDLRPQVSGEIVEVRFKDGERVKKGDVLFVIDPRPYRAVVQEASAELASARERHAHAGKELERARSLITTSAISERVLDERANAFAVTKSEIEAAEARLARARVDLGHAYVKAPISGRVSRAEITAGNLVQAGADAPLLTSIVSDDRIYADFEVDEQTYLRFVHAGARGLEAERQIPVRLEVGDENKTKIEGRIHSFDNRINPATGTIRARALFANSAGILLPGMFVRVGLGSPELKPAIVLTERAILTDQDRKFVYVIDSAGMASYRQVAIGPAVGEGRVITGGLNVGDRVITSNLMVMRPHTPVTPKAGPLQPATDSSGTGGAAAQ